VKTHAIALIDGNNFYVSCETVFNTSLQERPAIVLGNNDGCVIARNALARSIGIKMGTPFFKCKHLVQRYHGVVYSANYPLYQDMSNRMMSVLATLSPRLEPYSIDECFADFSQVPIAHLTEYGHAVKAHVMQSTGLPVSVGIAPTKVLAKLACEVAKKTRNTHGVVNVLAMTEQEIDELLTWVLAEDVWGIGAAHATRLKAYGIITARALKYADHVWVRHLLNVSAQRAVLELRGIPCLPLQTMPRPRRVIMVAQSFGRPIESLQEMEEAIAFYAGQAAEKLRRRDLAAGRIGVFLQTNPFDRQAPQYARSAETKLLFPSFFTPTLLAGARNLIRQIYQPGYRYKRAGVLLTRLQPQEVIQPDLFGLYSFEAQAKEARLMAVVDLVNDYFGRGTLRWAAQGLEQPWQMQQHRRSPRYTTRWNEILRVD
jgi:DNA polymerase V